MSDGDATCVHCAFGLTPVRLRRQWIHHFRDTGQIVVCVDRSYKPARLTAATHPDHGRVTGVAIGADF